MITVKYFASLREQTGRNQECVEDVSEIASVKDLKNVLSNTLPPQALCAVNYEYANDDTAIKDGDEVAFFPPVTGG
ncbi:MAG: molybdopterin converting factor subunit 1 [Chromatiales bacterium]|nr:molybdopterin converting factor subunit 1 [Chromatiales bacterium]